MPATTGLAQLMADDPTSYQIETVGPTSKVTAEHYSTKLAHHVIELLYYRLNTTEIEDGKVIQFVVYLVQSIN